MSARAFLGTSLQLDEAGELVVENGRLATVTGADCLLQDIRNRLATSPGGLLGHPEFGVGVPEWKGEVAGDEDLAEMAGRIRLAVLEDKRVLSVTECSLEQDASNDRGVSLRLAIETVTGPVAGTLIFPFGWEDR